MSSEVETSLEITHFTDAGEIRQGFLEPSHRATARRATSLGMTDKSKWYAATSGKSRNYLVAEYGKFGECNRHNMKTITLRSLVLCLAVAGPGQIASAQNDLNLPDVSQA